MLVELREGRAQPPLFAIPGAGGAAGELAAVARALPGTRPVLAFDVFMGNTVEAMAAEAAAAIRARQPRGPYHLMGYSFGGLVALEAARALTAAGGTVAFLGLIDAVYDRRHWPFPTFLAATIRRAGGHLARLARTPLRTAAPEFVDRARRLARRLLSRAGAGVEGPSDGSVQARAFAAMAAYRPTHTDLPVTLFTSHADADFGADAAALWRPLAPALAVRRIDAAHLALVRDPSCVAALANALDAEMTAAATPARPVVLVAASFNWVASSRLALGLAEAGFAVEAVCPRRHSLWKLRLPERLHRYSPVRPQASLARAIAASRPDLIVPCDDRAAQALHGLYARSDPATAEGAALRARLERSLGRAANFPVLYARADAMALAAEAGARHPRTERVRSRSDLEAWIAAHGLPAVLKTDGSWGGREVVFIREPSDIAAAYRRLAAAPSPLRAAKRLLLDGDPGPARALAEGRRPQLSVQAFVGGAAGNAAVACLDGEVLAAVYVEVVRSDGATGPATVVRVLDHPEMARSVAQMVRRLGLTGLCGFDFVLDAHTGAAHLIELNPRATPTAHLIGADGADLLGALHAGLTRRASRRRARPDYADGLVALFPQELRRDPGSDYLRTAHHDVPWDAPELVEAALAEAHGSRAALDQLARRLGRGTDG